MALTDRIRAPFRAFMRWAIRGVSLASEDAARILGFSRATLSGVHVTDRSALESPEYFAGIRNVSEDLATLPLYVYRRLGERKRELDPTHPLFEILHDMPNEEIDAVVFIEMLQAWLMMRRNSYAEIQRRNDGRVVGLWPIPTPQMSVKRVEGKLVYLVRLPPGERDPVTGLSSVPLRRDQVFHLKAFALDGILGESSIELHKEAIGVSLALDRYGAAFFGNDATPAGVYEVPGTLTPQAYERMKKELEEPHQGLSNKHRLALLEQGMKFKETSVPNDRAQFNESKRYSVEQMARLNRIPPHKVGDLSRATFDNIEHQGIDYVTSSIRTHAVRWERAILTQLFTRDERRSHFAEFLLDALLRGDAATRAEALAVWRQNGVINADEWRALENMNEIGDGSGKVYLVNGNMIPVAQAGEPRNIKLDPKGNIRELQVFARASDQHREIAASRVFAPLFRAAAETCLRKESAAVTKAIEREFRTKGMRAFEGWMLQFYRDQETTVRRAYGPLAVAVGEAVRGEEGPDLGEWADEYALAVAGARRKAATDSVREIAASRSSDMAGALVAMASGWASEEQIGRMAEREATAMGESLRRYLARETGRAA